MPATYTDRLDGLTTSVAVKAPCQAVAIANITLSGEQTVNGVAVTAGDRVLATAQTNSVDNGIWVVGTGTWARAKDFDGTRDAVQGTLVSVFLGGTESVLYQLTTADPVVIGTTALAFEPATRLSQGQVAFVTADEITDDSAELIAISDKLEVKYPEAGTLARPLSGKALEFPSPLDWIPPSKHAGIKARTNTDDLTEYLQAMLDCGEYSFVIPDGQYGIEGKLIQPAGTVVDCSGGATIKRLGAKTDALLLLKGEYTKWHGGAFQTLNNHPNGIVQLGHENATTSRWNAFYWQFTKVNLFGVQASGNVGIYVPSTQLAGGGFANYFGTIRDVTVFGSDVGTFLPEFSNGHQIFNVSFYNMITYGHKLRGAYGNTIQGGFLHTSTNGVVGLGLLNHVAGSGHDSVNNQILGYGCEPGGATSKAVVVESGCSRNTVLMNGNVAGTNTISNTDNDINTHFQTSFRGGNYYLMNIVPAGDFISQGTHQVGYRKNYRISGSVAENVTKTFATVTIGAANRGAIVEVKIAGRATGVLNPGGGVGVWRIHRLSFGGAVSTNLSLNTAAAGVILSDTTVTGNNVNLRVKGFNAGTGTTFNFTAEVVVISDTPDDFAVA